MCGNVMKQTTERNISYHNVKTCHSETKRCTNLFIRCATLLHKASKGLKAPKDKRMKITLFHKASTRLKAFVNELFLECDIGF